MSDPKIIDTWETRLAGGLYQTHRLVTEDENSFAIDFIEDGKWVRAEVIDLSVVGVHVFGIQPSLLASLCQRIEQLCAEKREVN